MQKVFRGMRGRQLFEITRFTFHFFSLLVLLSSSPPILLSPSPSPPLLLPRPTLLFYSPSFSLAAARLSLLFLVRARNINNLRSLSGPLQAEIRALEEEEASIRREYVLLEDRINKTEVRCAVSATSSRPPLPFLSCLPPWAYFFLFFLFSLLFVLALRVLHVAVILMSYTSPFFASFVCGFVDFVCVCVSLLSYVRVCVPLLICIAHTMCVCVSVLFVPQSPPYFVFSPMVHC